MKSTIPTEPKALVRWLRKAPEPWELSESTATKPTAPAPACTSLRESAAADGGTMKLELREFTILQ